MKNTIISAAFAVTMLCNKFFQFEGKLQEALAAVVFAGTAWAFLSWLDDRELEKLEEN